MDAKEIDGLFEAVLNDDIDYILECAGMKGEISEEELDDEEVQEKMVHAIYEKIKQGDYAHFREKIEDGNEEHLQIGAMIIKCSHDDDEIKSFVEKAVKLGLDKYTLAELIIGVQDNEYIKKCITRREELGLKKTNTLYLMKQLGRRNPEYLSEFIENMEDYSLTSFEVKELLIDMNDPEYISKCIENREQIGISDEDAVEIIIRLGWKDPKIVEGYIENAEKYKLKGRVVALVRDLGRKDPAYIEKYISRREEIGLTMADTISLITQLNDPELIDKYVSRKEEFGFTGEHILEIIRGTKDPERVEEYIRDRKKLGLDSSSLKLLIIETGNLEYIKGCIDRRDEIGLKPSDTIYLIKELDTEYIKKCIEERGEFGFSNEDIIYLIKATKDPAYIDECIEKREEFRFDSSDIISLIRDVGRIDATYLEKYILRKEEFGFDEEEVMTLITNMKDPSMEFVRMCIDRSYELRLSLNEIGSIIKQVKNPSPEFVQECIENGSEYGLNKEEIVDLITRTNDPKFIKQCISRREELDFSDLDIIKMGVSLGPEFIDEIITSDNTKIVLPIDMKIGIEIESVGKEAQWIWERKKLAGWQSKGDGSLQPDRPDETGVEVISPILQGDHEDSTRQIKRVCTALEMLNQHSNDSCGGHVHIGDDYLKSPQAWENLRQLWDHTEFILFVISNPEGELPRPGVFQYAIPSSGETETQLGDGTVSLANEQDIEAVKEKLAPDSRYRALNLFNLDKGIEFRLPNGTVSARTWIENINLFGGIVKAAQDLAEIQQKAPSERTEEEQYKLECFERIKSGELTEEETLDMLLEVVALEEIQEVYRRRYEVNRELLRERPDIEEGLRDAMKKPKTETELKNIKKNVNEIGKEIYTSETRVTGSENRDVSRIMPEELENEKKDHSQDTQIE